MRLQALLFVGLASSVGCSVDAPTYTAGDGASGDDAADVDGPMTDGPSVDAMTGSWSEPESLALNSSQFEGAPRAAPSELELYFSAETLAEPISDIYRVNRAEPSAQWGTARTFINGTNTSQSESDPELSATGVEMHFTRGGANIWVAKRPTVMQAWQTATATGIFGSRPDILEDGMTMYYFDPSADCPVELCRTRVTRSTPTSAWTGAELESISDEGSYQLVDVSADGLRALLSGPSTIGDPPVAIVTRSTLSAAWSSPQIVSDLTPYTSMRSARWSWDEQHMYLTSNTGGTDIYVRTTLLSALLIAVVACSGRSDSGQPKRKPDATGSARKAPTALELAREKYLMLDAALAKLEREIGEATDPEALSLMKDKRLALELAIKDAREQIQLMEQQQKPRPTP